MLSHVIPTIVHSRYYFCHLISKELKFREGSNLLTWHIHWCIIQLGSHSGLTLEPSALVQSHTELPVSFPMLARGSQHFQLLWLHEALRWDSLQITAQSSLTYLQSHDFFSKCFATDTSDYGLISANINNQIMEGGQGSISEEVNVGFFLWTISWSSACLLMVLPLPIL